jgi:alpha-ketoglutaric semialdehyde dehydrogenase
METRNLIGYNYQPGEGDKFKAIDPSLGIDLPGDFYAASISEADAAMNLADNAFATYRNIGTTQKAAFYAA